MNDKLICIKDADDPKLIDLLSDGWKIIQISAAGIYCWVLLSFKKIFKSIAMIITIIILVILAPILNILLFSNKYDENDEEY